MKDRVVALMMISVMLPSSISLALSLTSRSTPKAQEYSIPPEAFEGLGSKKGVGFGDWTVNSEYPDLTIFSYPAGSALDKGVTAYEYWVWDPVIGEMRLAHTYYVYEPVYCHGWDGYLVDMLMTITVTMDTAEQVDITRQVDVTFWYLNWFWNRTYLQLLDQWVEFYDCTKASTTLTVGIASGFPQSVTFTGQIYLVTLTLVGTEGSAGGHYFVSADRRV